MSKFLFLLALLAPAAAAAVPPAPPLAFEPNAGQADARVRYLARGTGYTLFLAEREAVFALGGRALRMRPVGARAPRAIEAEQPLPGRSHYIDLARGAVVAGDVAHAARVRYRGVYRGVDLVYYGREGRLEYDFEVAAGADPGQVALEFEGADRLALADDGALEIELGGEQLRFEPPVSYQQGPHGREPVASRYVLDQGKVRFALGAYDPARRLVIDPVFVYASYLGGSDEDRAYAVKLNAAGEAYVTGETRSLNFPLVNALDPTHGGDYDAYVTKFGADGSTVLFSTFLGGAGAQSGTALALDPAGNIYVAGTTNGHDMFELKLNATASAIVYTRTIATLGGYDFPSGIVADAAGNAYLVGQTSSGDFPVVNAFTPTYGGGNKGFFRKLDAAGNVLVSSFIGAGAFDVHGGGIALDPGGNPVIAGLTAAIDPDGDAFVLELNAAGTAILWSKRYGGTDRDMANDVAVDAGGNVYVAGDTYSSDFPLAGAPDTSYAGPGEGFALKTDASGNVLATTFLGGEHFDGASDVAIEPGGAVLVSGSSAFPGYFDRRSITWRLSSTLSGVVSTAYYGACDYTVAEDVATHATGIAFVVSNSTCTLPTTPGAFRSSRPGGGGDGHVAKIDMVAMPSLSVNDRSRLEGTSNGNHDIFVSVIGNAAADISVNWATANGTALGGSDFVAASGTLALPAGSGGQYLNVTVLGDYVSEPDETFLLNLSGPVNATLADGQGLETIRNDDPSNGTLQLAACSASEAAGVATVTVTRANGAHGPVGVSYTTGAGTAAAGVDYTAVSGSLDWPHADGSARSFDIPLVDDGLHEGNETIGVALSAPTGGAALGSPSGIACTIVENEPVPTLSVDDVSTTEGSGAVFVLRASNPSAYVMSASAATANGSAVAGSDYTATTALMQIAAGQTSSGGYTVATTADTLEEGNEGFVLNLATPAHATLADAQAVATIVDNDEGGVVAFGASTVAVNESGGSALVAVSRSSGTASAVTVAYATSNATATAGSDYTATSGTLTFGANQSSATITVPIANDALDEPAESLSVTLSSPTGGATLGAPVTATITIADDEATPTLSADGGGCSVTEPATGTAACRFTWRLSGASASNVTFTTATTAGSASTADFTPHAATARTIAAGQTTLAIDVPVLADALDEADESFALVASNAANATLAVATATGTIVDSDAPPSMSVDGAGCSVSESAGPCRFTLRLSVPSGRDVTFTTATANGTATAGADYAAHAATARTISAGATTLAVDVPVLGDTGDEPDESFTLAVAAITHATPATLGATGTILDDDAPAGAGTLAFAPASYGTGESGSVTLTVTRTGSTAGTVGVAYETNADTASGGADYTQVNASLSFAPGESQKTIVVPIASDAIDEADESFDVQLGAPSGGATLGAANIATVTIVDDDPLPILDVSDCTALEGGSGTASCGFSVTTVGATARTMQFDVMTFDGSANAPGDYVARAYTQILPPGASSTTISIDLVGDTLPEPDETYELRLANLVNVVAGDVVGTGTIRDDDQSAGTIGFRDGATRLQIEGSPGFTLVADRLDGTVGAATVAYTVTPGTATPGADFTGASGTLAWAAGEGGFRVIALPILDDALLEGRETFTVTLGPPSGGATLRAPSAVTVTIEDNEDLLLINGFEGTGGRQ